MTSPAAAVRTFFLKRLLASPRAAFPVTLDRRRVYVFPTRHGFVFGAVLFAMLLGSMNHNNNLGFILTFLLGGMAFVSIFHTWRNIARITLASVRCEPVFAGQSAQFTFVVRAPGHRRSHVVFHFLYGEETATDLAPDVDTLVRVPHATRSRGVLKPTVLYVSTTYPFGLVRGWATVLPEASCLVYPAPAPGPLATSRAPGEEDEGGEAGGPGVDDFAGLASYQPGDPLQHISWKAFSRGQGLYTKKFEGQLGNLVYFDPDELPGRGIERKLSRICHMILTAEATRTAYGLRLGGMVIEPGLGGPHKRRCLRELALLGGREAD